MILRLPLVGLLTVVACGDPKQAPGARKTPLETAIARELTAKLGVPVTASCAMVVGLPAKCEAALGDGTKLPIEIASEQREWAWRVAGLVIETAPIKAHVDATLGDLKIAQQASCGGKHAFVERGGRLGCKLSGGGMAFVKFAEDGTAALELALDAASAAARGELVTPERDRELTAISKALEHLEGESDGEEELPPSDGGVAKP
ncbi:MAG TPA: hypothetical protein VIV11_42435 [Kofleriaceae bacterium]